MKRIIVEIVGVLPIIFSNKCKPYCIIVRENIGSQINEYPKHLLDEYRIVTEYYTRIMRDFGNHIEVKVVNPMSIRGLRLALRFKTSRGIYFVINNNIAIHIDQGYDNLKKAIENEIEKLYK